MIGSKCARKRRTVHAVARLPRRCDLGCGREIANGQSVICPQCSQDNGVCEDCGRKCGYKRPRKPEQRLLPGIESAPEPQPERPAPTHEQIQKRAYLLFVRRGCLHGFDQVDYFEAERQLNEGIEDLA